MEIARDATAMRRSTWSRPVGLALDHEIIRKETSFLDYGCGHGDDFHGLRSLGFDATGWDPLHAPEGELRDADVVNIGFVLNVIEDPDERAETLRAAYRHARSVLIVAVRVDRSLKDAECFGDGVLTKRNTFQKIFTQAEFREYLKQVLNAEPMMADLGVAYIFRDQEAEARYLATRTFGRRLAFQHDLHERFAQDELGRALVAVSTELGRLPKDDEFAGWHDLAQRFGGLGRVGRLVWAAIDAEEFAGSLTQRAEDIMVYLAKLRFSGVRVPKYSALPKEIQRDIRAIFGKFQAAKDESLVLLFAMGQPREVAVAMKHSPVGKKVSGELYAHISAVDSLPPVLRMLEFTARRVVGQVEADVVKFGDKGRAVSFLRYPSFDSDPHPALRSSVRVNLPQARYDVREYGEKNPFVLHRKELFVTEDYPLWQQFAELSLAEHDAGLLGGSTIGTREGWKSKLGESGYRLAGHHLVKL